jgi:DNA-binding response OmpR family regulator
MLQVQEQPALEAPTSRAASAPILLIQPDARLLHALSVALKGSGLEVRACETLAQAEEACRQSHFSLLITDWVVDGLFADEVLAMLGNILYPHRLPASLVLSRLSEADTRDCLHPDSPVTGIVTRPSNHREFNTWAPIFASTIKQTLAAMGS